MRFHIIGFVKKQGIHFREVHERLDVHGLRGFDVHAFEILILQHHEFSGFGFISFHNLPPRHFLAVLFGDAFVIHRAQILAAEEAEFQILAAGGGVEGDGNIDQSKTDGAFPDGVHNKRLREGGAHGDIPFPTTFAWPVPEAFARP